MQTNIHIHEDDTHEAFRVSTGDSYVALDIADADQGRVVAFVSSEAAAQQLVEAAIEIRAQLRERRDKANLAELSESVGLPLTPECSNRNHGAFIAAGVPCDCATR